MAPITRPHFANPPLIEQAITVTFKGIEAFTLGDFGLFWRHIVEEFPACESQPVLPQSIEKFGTPASSRIGLRLMEAGFLPRCFYKSEDGRELVQVQQNRFTFNWIKVDSAEYPRSEVLVPRFAELFRKFTHFLAEERSYGIPQIVQCELTNVNIISVDDFGASIADAPNAFRLQPLSDLSKALEIESYSYANHYLIRSPEGEPIGRLHAQLEPVLSIESEEQVYKLELTARGRPDSSDLEGALRFFSLGRDVINCAFMASTTEEIHSRWGYDNGIRP